MGAFQAVELFGSFFSIKTRPADIDIALEFKPTEEPIAAVEPLFNKERIREEFGTDVVLKALNSGPYQPMLPKGFGGFASDKLATYRQLKREEFSIIGQKLKRPPGMTEEFKGIIRVALHLPSGVVPGTR